MDITTLPLAALNAEQWEQLCDGCGVCCMHKFEDEDSGEVFYSNIACRLFDATSCRCGDYAHRFQRVPECLAIDRLSAAQYAWLPEHCAYRLRHEGKPLPAWHPLVCGDAEEVHRIGISMREACVSEDEWRD
ncbi:MAG: YcgN family cysteine cluster protein [Zetaproteobacteria bacterium]|nr:MAG: YcgN family cysteine cluster protein [Zetaproteobacteria bacterium]